MLHGRDQEVGRISELLTEAQAGRSAALAVIAEPGGGKSALLQWAGESAQAEGFQVLRCTGIESESELPFAALQLLLSPVVGRLDVLPVPQADALRTAFGLARSGGTDRFLVGLASLSLLAELSTGGPVLCLVDDAQWLDRPSAEALLFAARRLAAEGVVFLFAGREEFSAPGLAELRPARLDRAAARGLLAEHAPKLAAHVRDRVLAEAGGNPLALLELPRTDPDLSSVGPLPLPHRLQDAYQRRIAELAEGTRTALLIVAAEETGDLATVLKVMTVFGLTAEVLADAEQCRLVTVTDRLIVFRHPLMRTAAYQGSAFTRRLAAHAAIADSLTDSPVGDPDRVAWHRAAAATGPDEAAAAGLDAAAARARERTGYASAVAALERAAYLSTEDTARVRRLVAAAGTAVDAGWADRARRLADQAGRLTTDPRDLARLAGVRARIEFEHGSLRTAYETLVGVVDTIAPVDPDLAGRLLVEAAVTAWTTGDPGRVGHTYKRLLELPPSPVRDAMLQGVVGPLNLLSEDAAVVSAGVALLRGRALGGGAVGGAPFAADPGARLTLALYATLVGEFQAARENLLSLADECRGRGMVGLLPAVLAALALAEALLGRFRDAGAAAEECVRISEDTGQRSRTAQAEGMLAFLAAVGGDEERCRTFAERSLRTLAAKSNVVSAVRAEWALALLDLGLGRYGAALDRMEAAARGPVRFVGHDVAFAADQVEAAVRLGSPGRAAEPLARIERWLNDAPAPWTEALFLRCRALLAGSGAGSGEGFARARELHAEDGGHPFDQARTALLYGEWLRRERRKTEARTQLRDALEGFERLGALPWAEHARAELRAAGEGALQVFETDLVALLTPQELQVVRLASTGATNKEIGSHLFLSPKTVGHHLYRAFPKLGVSTRTELARLDLG